jgi:uncharacterized protein
LSIDGILDSHDRHRKTIKGKGTFYTLQKRIELLLRYQPYASALAVINPDTVEFYYDSVQYLLDIGFKYLIVSLNYAGKWSDSNMKVLKNQYVKLAKLYEELILKEKKFYFSPFEMKLASYIKGEVYCHKCQLDNRQISIAPDGKIYPCVQFVGDSISNREYSIGNIWDGIDEEKKRNLFKKSQEFINECKECALSGRCNNNCGCLNWQTTGQVNMTSPVLCETERILIPIVDALGEKLYRMKAPMFIQKHYNSVYPILSLIEDTYQ